MRASIYLFVCKSKADLFSYGSLRNIIFISYSAPVRRAYSGRIGRRTNNKTTAEGGLLSVYSELIENLMLAPTYSAPFGSTFGDGSLNCRVRNENGCTPPAKAPTLNFQSAINFTLNTVK